MDVQKRPTKIATNIGRLPSCDQVERESGGRRMIIQSECVECKRDNAWPFYQVFSVKEWICEGCFGDFVFGDDEE